MEIPSSFSAGDAPRVMSSTVIALYDPASGQIQHVHTVHRHEGAPPSSAETVIEDARRSARLLGLDTSQLTAAVSSNMDHGRLRHRIDVVSGQFIAEPRTSSPG